MNWTPYFFRSFCLYSRTMLDMYWMWPEWASAAGSGHQGELGPFQSSYQLPPGRVMLPSDAPERICPLGPPRVGL